MESTQAESGKDAAIDSESKPEVTPNVEIKTDPSAVPPPAAAQLSVGKSVVETQDVEMEDTPVAHSVPSARDDRSETVGQAASSDLTSNDRDAGAHATASTASDPASRGSHNEESIDGQKETAIFASIKSDAKNDGSEDDEHKSSSKAALGDQTDGIAAQRGGIPLAQSALLIEHDKNEGTTRSESSDTVTGNQEDGEDVQSKPDNPAPVGGELEDAAVNGKKSVLVASGEPETIMDDSPYVSSDSDSDSDSSDSDSSSDRTLQDDGVEPDYEMMTVEEQAARLLKEDREDHDGSTTAKEVRTIHEKPDETVTKPDIQMTPETKICELGKVETTVENQVVIKANTTGEYSVLDYGSALCLEDRTIVGAIAETIGQVRQPYYIVLFTNAKEITELGIKTDTKIFYVEEHSTSVFTEPLQGVKGSDASNLYDEEVADHEMAFSDDEKEAEFKRQRKEKRRTKGQGDGQMDGFSKPPQGNRASRRANDRGRGRGAHHPNGMRQHMQYQSSSDAPGAANSNQPEALNYDDAPSSELYQPLTRPTNLYNGTSAVSAPVVPAPPVSAGAPSGGFGPRGRGQHFNQRGRGFGRGHPPASQPLPHNPPPQHPYPPSYGYPPPQSYPVQAPHQPNPNPQTPYPGPQMQGYPPSSSSPYQPYQQTYPQYPNYPFQQQYNQYPNNQQQQPHHHAQPYQQQPQQQQQQIPNLPAGAHVNPNFFRQQGGQGGYDPNFQPR